MSLSLLRTLLLVFACGVAAHAQHVIPGQFSNLQFAGAIESSGIAPQRDIMKYNEDNDNKNVVNMNKKPSRRTLLSPEVAAADNIRLPLSVVQDWSLVCQQLCGAGLAGAPCKAHCNRVDIPLQQQQANADALLNSNKEAICYDLCGLQLGDAACHCALSDPNELKTDLNTSERNTICNSFCQHNATLIGCSLCASIADVELNPVVDDVKSYEIISSIRMPRSVDSTTTTTATTPNWIEVCATLCKTGDGGSLCNCDLSPFNGRKY